MSEYICDFITEENNVQRFDVNEELVRCKYCRYKQDDITHNFCEINHHKCYDDDFCSWGERNNND